jgi:hypothetical protein
MTQKKLDSSQIRQGDVLIVRVDDAPKAKSEGAVVIAYGEVTGHKHQFMAESKVSYLGNTTGLERYGVPAEAKLLHEEHTAPVVPAGLYERPVQVEWTDAMEPRVVAD